MKPLRLLLADDHTLVRAGLRALLDAMDGVSVVAETDNGEQAVALAREHAPDVALLDITMPGLNGLQAAERILAQSPQTRVIILSMHAGEEYVNRALALGVSGYLLKDAATLELQAALEAVAAGQTYLSPRLTSRLLESHAQGESAPKPALTARQLEVLRLLSLGKSVKEIAYDLQLSAKTVETYRAQIMDRLDLHDLASLVRYAIRNGLIGAQ
ncbi:MAG: response regulator transcription factor [Betaproteobacteria bacterium]|nr:response regulator transcription factor [Betaproteobacteria bacterium]